MVPLTSEYPKFHKLKKKSLIKGDKVKTKIQPKITYI